MKITTKLMGVFVMLSAFNLNATNYFVKPSGGTSAAGTSWATAATLTRALTLATNNNGDVIYLAAGNYDVTSSSWNSISLAKGGEIGRAHV